MVQSSDIGWEIFLKAERFSLHFPSTFISTPHKSVLKLPFGYCQREKNIYFCILSQPGEWNFTHFLVASCEPLKIVLFHDDGWSSNYKLLHSNAINSNLWLSNVDSFSRSPSHQMWAEIKLFFIIFHHQQYKIFMWILVWTSKRLHKLERLKMISLTRQELTHFHLLKCEFVNNQ